MMPPNPESDTPDVSSHWQSGIDVIQSLRLQSELDRQSQVDLSRVRVRVAQSDADFQLVADIRQAGFGRLANTAGQTAWLDAMDRSAGCFSLIGCTSDGQPLATLRVQDSRLSWLELEQFVPLHELVGHDGLPAAQCSRLSVLKSPASADVMYGLFKTVWRWAVLHEIQSMLLTTPPWSMSIYEAMCFDSLGPPGEFIHHYADGALHTTMRIMVPDVERIWRTARNPLCTQFFDIRHPNLELE